jgi:hypothetical protein
MVIINSLYLLLSFKYTETLQHLQKIKYFRMVELLH